MTQLAFAKLLNISNVQVSYIENGHSYPGDGPLMRLKELGFNPVWVESGMGPQRLFPLSDLSGPSPKYPRSISDPSEASDRSDSAVRDAPSSSSAFEPLSPLRARQLPILGRVPAGTPGPSWVEEHREGFFPMSYELVPDPHAFVLRVIGESMAPEIEEGDLVVVSPALRGKVKNGDLVVARRDDGDTWVKRYSRSRARAFLVSSNPTHPPILLDSDQETTIIGKVVFTIHRYK